jgi:8-oxo-dGTP diphosphatase
MRPHPDPDHHSGGRGWHAGVVRHWTVAGGLLADARGLLLVANRRRDGRVDWSTPGGVVDAGETFVEALGREVTEETGLVVETWQGPCWTVEVEFADLEMHLAVEVHQAIAFAGDLVLDDPDGIVTDAEFVSTAAADERLRSAPMWVAQPLAEWLRSPWDVARHFGYVAHGTNPASMRAERRDES